MGQINNCIALQSKLNNLFLVAELLIIYIIRDQEHNIQQVVKGSLHFTIKKQMRKIYEEDNSSYYSNNELNMAFIADNSRDIQSLSLCGSLSDRSVSQISRINSVPGSPYTSYQPEISNMEEWPKEDHSIFFQKKNTNFSDFRKRQTRHSIPQQIQQVNEDQREIEKMSKCTKKRIGQKNKIITIQQGNNLANQNQYGLRSKAKLTVIGTTIPNNDHDSSSDQLRQMVAQMGDKKNTMKNYRRMLPQ